MINHVATGDKNDSCKKYIIKNKQIMLNNPMKRQGSLSGIIRGYKARVTKETRKIDPAFKWQSRFYDRIIRTEQELSNVRNYIKNNPKKWL